MKKILSLLFVLFMGMTMWAETVTMQYTGSTTTNMTANNNAEIVGLSSTDWSVTATKCGNNYPGLNKDGTIRLYYNAAGSSTITVESLSGKIINNINVTYKPNNNNGKVLVNNVEVTDNNGIYEINNTSFVITNGNTTNIQVHIVSIVIDFGDGETPPEPPTPTITEIATAAEFIALENNKEFKFTGDLVCVQDYVVSGVGNSGQPYTNRYLYVADETGGIVIFNPDANTPSYETKDVISGGWTAKKTIYRGLPEATEATDFVEATETRHLDPIEMTIDAANNSTNYGAYIIIKNVLIRPQSDNMLMEENGPSTHDKSVMITDGSGNNIILFSNHTAPFNLPTNWETDTRYDVVGILGVYNTTQQIFPVGIKLNDETITSITNIESSVKKVIYYNTQGIQSSKPHDGLNIVVTEFENGTKKINKQIYKF